jgi:hypothetical protein
MRGKTDINDKPEKRDFMTQFGQEGVIPFGGSQLNIPSYVLERFLVQLQILFMIIKNADQECAKN